MPQVPRIAGEWSMLFGRAAVVVTVGCWVALVVTVSKQQLFEHQAAGASGLETICFLFVISMLAASAVAYLVARLGFYYRAARHRRIPRAVLDQFFTDRQPSLTALVPSYQEERSVILMTLLSIALQEFPDLRVVLLIDDPPKPRYRKSFELLRDARDLPGQVEAMLAEPQARFAAAQRNFERRIAPLARERTLDGVKMTSGAVNAAADEYEYAAAWLAQNISGQPDSDHAEHFFCAHVLGQLQADLSLFAAALRAAANDAPHRLSAADLGQLYQRLAWTFSAKVTSFERKRYVSLSAEANKAMNLNSYIGLMGASYAERETPAGRILEQADPGPDTVEIPASDYVMTVDADSVLLPEYALRLVYMLEQPENAGVAVAQTPYSSFPGSKTRIERIAGATTDLQHIVHQGMTYHEASFWVGANAVLRRSALMQIERVDHSSGFAVRRYISDRTVIEDTESTIDLAALGWKLYNYPERLAYSATPPDFGSLCIQRHRWANGGLLILPKLWRCVRLRRKRGETTGIGELLLRTNYMGSVFWSSLFVLVLMLFRFDGRLLTPLTYLIAVPYFLAIAVDLRYCGYEATDALRIYGFNLLLLPVNLAGSLSSAVQALTGSKGQFVRTPKVRDRTVPAFIYVVLPYVLVVGSVYTAVEAYHEHLWGAAVFAALNAVLASYAIIAFVGLGTSLVDIWINVVSWLYKPQRYQPTPSRREPPRETEHQNGKVDDWEMVLYLGFADRRRRPRDGSETPPVITSEQEPDG